MQTPCSKPGSAVDCKVQKLGEDQRIDIFDLDSSFLPFDQLQLSLPFK
jgi:hypothetical protein